MFRIAGIYSLAILSLLICLSGCDVDTAPDESPPDIVQIATVDGGLFGDKSYMFVIHRKHNSVSRLDMETLDIKTIKVGQRPFTLDITPDGKTVIVANRDDRSVSIIDTVSANVQNVYVGTDPRDIAIRHDGRYAAVANFENNSFTLIDLEEKNVEPFLCPDGPISVDFTADGSLLLASSYWNSSLCVFDMEEMDSAVVLDLEPSDDKCGDNEDGDLDQCGYYTEWGAQQVLAGPADSLSENLAFVALRSHTSEDSEMVILDWKEMEVVERKSIGPAPASLTVNTDGDLIYALGKDMYHGPNWVAEFEILENFEVRERFRYNIDRDPTSILANPKRDEVYVACRKKNKIKLLDTKQKLDFTIKTWDRPYTIGVNPSGSRLFVAHDDDDHGRVSVIDTESRKVLTTKKMF